VAREARAAAGDRNVWVVGGGATAAQFAELDELDELIVTVMPITLGSGARLLPARGGPHHWQLASASPFDNGAVELRYRRDRAPAPA
jgi:dihydrofolate reductase